MKKLLKVVSIFLLFAVVVDAGNKKVKIEDERNLEAKIAKMDDPSSPWSPWRLGSPPMEIINFRSASHAGGALWVSGGVLPATGTPLKHFAWYFPADRSKGHVYVPLPIAPTSATSTSVRFSSISAGNDSVAIVGMFTGSIIRTENRGAKWDTVRVGGTGGFNDGIRFLNKDTAVAFGDMEDSLLWIGRSVNGGKTWTRLSVRPTKGFVEGNEVSADSAYKIFKLYDWATGSTASTMSVFGKSVWLQSYSSAGGLPPLVLKSTDAGTSWEVITGKHKFGTRTAISTIYFVNDSLGFVTSGGGANPYRLFKSINGGRTWGDSIAIEPFTVTAANQNPYSVSAVPGSSTIWCYGFSAATGSKTWKSTDQGVTWTAVNTPGLSNLNGGVFANDSMGMAFGYKNLLQYRPSMEYTFTVNTATVPDTLKANSFVQMRGNLLGWGGDGPRLTNIGGDYWSAKLRFSAANPADTLFYKIFTNVAVQGPGSAGEHNGWEKNLIDPSGNRRLVILNSDSVLPILYVNGTQADQNQYWTPFRTHSADSIGVMFRVSMQGVPDYNADEHKVGIRGQYIRGQDTARFWGNSFILTQEKDHGNASVYPGKNFWSGILYLKKPTASETLKVEYKFVRHGKNDAVTADPQLWEETPNRTFNKIGSYTKMLPDTTLFWKWFSDKVPKPVVTGNIAFTVDLKPYIDMGVFDQAKDTLYVHGAFNGWGHSNLTNSLMQLMPGTKTYALTITGHRGAVGDKMNYKFFMFQKDTSRPKGKSGWEVPLSAGGGNRELVFAGTTSQSIKKYFNDVYPENLMPANHTIKLNLKMDLRAEIKKTTTPKFVIGTSVLSTEYSADEWNEGIRTVVNYSDTDGDSIYSATINYTTTKPTPNALMYTTKYTGGTAEGGGFDYGRYRVRYIVKTTSGAWPTEYTFPTDVYTQAPPLVVEVNPYITEVKKEEGIIPTEYTLLQNYPNPFNPSTKIIYTVPMETKVSLKIFNILGQEVATLVNEKQVAGKYSVDFNASKLASGIYVYRLDANNVTFTKKMMLMK